MEVSQIMCNDTKFVRPR